MASTYWIKLYYEILDDPKMGRLPDHVWRRSVELFLMAGEAGNGGYLPSVQDIAWRLRSTDADILECLEALRAINITNVTQDGEWIVTHFADRQNAPSNAERQARYRERKQKANYYGNETSNEPRNAKVTERNVDIDIDIDIDKDDGGGAPRPTIYSVYEQNIGPLTKIIADRLDLDVQDYTEAWVIDAIGEAVRYNARSLAYVEKVLETRKRGGGKRGGKPAKQTDDEFRAAMMAEAARIEREGL